MPGGIFLVGVFVIIARTAMWGHDISRPYAVVERSETGMRAFCQAF